MEQLNHYKAISIMKKIPCDYDVILYLCGLSAENTGMILRSAKAFGIKKVIYNGEKLDCRKLKKISRIPGYEIISGDIEIILSLKKEGYVISALEITDKSIPIDKYKFPKKICIVVGNENSGVPSDILSLCDNSFYIPMVQSELSSLNVSVATSIALYKCMEYFLSDID